MTEMITTSDRNTKDRDKIFLELTLLPMIKRLMLLALFLSPPYTLFL
jgi:hypothetical protein